MFEKLREGTNAFMDYMEEQMIDLYGAFPRYEPLADPPPRVLPPLPDDPQEVPLSQVCQLMVILLIPELFFMP